jgi:hypothetical protein
VKNQKHQAAGDDTGQAVGGVATEVGADAKQATEQVGQAAGAAVQQIGSAAGAAVQQVGQAVEASGKASWTPSKGEGAKQRRRPASRRSGQGDTKRGSKRGTRSRSSDGGGK